MKRFPRLVVFVGLAVLTIALVTAGVAAQEAPSAPEGAAGREGAAGPEVPAVREVPADTQVPAALEVTGALDVPAGSSGVGGWLRNQRDRLQNSLQSSLQEYRSVPRARFVFMILGLAFLYGLLHAFLPGHRKTLLVAYFLAEDAEPHRGVIAGVVFAALQGTAAVVVVLGASELLASSVPDGVERIDDVIDSIGLISAALIGALGLALTGIKAWEAVAARHHHQEERILSKLKTVSDDIDPDHHDPAREMIYDHRRAGRRRRIREGVLFPAMLIAGILPSSGTAVLMVTAVSLGTVGLGVLGAIAMSAGTAVTLAGIAVGTIVLRSRLLLLLRARIAHIVGVVVELAAALLVLAFAAILLIPALG